MFTEQKRVSENDALHRRHLDPTKASPEQVRTNTFAEARALLFGLQLCHRLGYSKVAVESDSKIIVDSICGGAVPWAVSYMIRSCKTFLLPSMSISHIYREGNQSADTLATHGHSHQQHLEFISTGSPLTACKAVIIQDRYGICTYRGNVFLLFQVYCFFA